MKTAIFTAIAITALAIAATSPADAKGRHHHGARSHHYHHYRHHDHAKKQYVKRHRHQHAHRSGHSLSLAGQPAPLVAKVQELIRECGARVISGHRAGARIAGSGRVSNHALNKADDLVGNPSCMYAHLRNWPGGYSTDYGRVRHLHISYNPNKEWGVRFAHGGRSHGRLASRHYRHRHIHVASARRAMEPTHTVRGGLSDGI